jgi:mannose-1-phosphate guanylyltransferase/mannose-1-phosphate guanylyltransferase/phosphomannomutase
MKAMLLAAGLGTRLRPLTYELPKPMVPVLGRPVMEHILRLLARHGFDDVVANLHYFPDLIRDRFGDGSEYGLRLVYSYEPELMGTAGGVRNVRDHFGGETFLIISGDALTDIDLTALWRAHKEKGGIATLALKRVDDPSQLGVVIVDEHGRIQGFQEKPDPAEALSNLGNCGIYVFEPEIFDFFPEPEFVDWAMDVFPKLLEQDVGFYGHEFPEYWNDVGSLEEYRQGNFDALEGRVHVDMAGLGNGEVPGDAEIEGPVFIGQGCEIAPGVRLTGPVVIGEGSRIGENSALRDTIVWPRTEVEPGTVLIGAVAGERPLADKL